MRPYNTIAPGASVACLILLLFPTTTTLAVGLKEEAVLYRQQGHANEQAGDVVSAFTYYRKAVAMDPESPDGHAGLGRLYHHEGDVNAALAAYTQALRFNPTHLDSLTALAKLYDATSRPVEARSAWRAVGAAAEEQRKYGLAASAYEEMLASQPEDVDAQAGLARVYDRLKDRQRATAAWLRVGSMHEARGQHSAAMDAYERALALDPQNVELARRVADLAVFTNQPDRGARSPLVRKFIKESLTPAAAEPQRASAPPPASQSTSAASPEPVKMKAAAAPAALRPVAAVVPPPLPAPHSQTLAPSTDTSRRSRFEVAEQEHQRNKRVLEEFDATTRQWQ